MMGMHLKSEIAQRELSDLCRRSLPHRQSYHQNDKPGSKCNLRFPGGSSDLRRGCIPDSCRIWLYIKKIKRYHSSDTINFIAPVSQRTERQPSKI